MRVRNHEGDTFPRELNLFLETTSYLRGDRAGKNAIVDRDYYGELVIVADGDGARVDGRRDLSSRGQLSRVQA
jgi:hypothetical protein